jgi:hypothetical protein
MVVKSARSRSSDGVLAVSNARSRRSQSGADNARGRGVGHRDRRINLPGFEVVYPAACTNAKNVRKLERTALLEVGFLGAPSARFVTTSLASKLATSSWCRSSTPTSPIHFTSRRTWRVTCATVFADLPSAASWTA